MNQDRGGLGAAVLWIARSRSFSGTGSSNMSDGGTTSRVFGSFITWLQEKRSPVFVIATANNVTQLPPELLRKGRFDEIFFCDLPQREERKTIVGIHLAKKKRNPADYDLEKMADATADFSGAEIETAVVAALYDSFDAGEELSSERLLTSIGEIVPLSVTMREVIESMRDWARTRARPASSKGAAQSSKRKAAQEAGASLLDSMERKLEL